MKLQFVIGLVIGVACIQNTSASGMRFVSYHTLYSGVARTSPLLGHSMHTTFVRTSARSAEAYGGGGGGGVRGHPSPPENLGTLLAASHIGFEAIYRKSNPRMMSL